ncbi:MAG: hypothetical protein V9E99_03055 [Microthrixaceae bacterium]
MPSRRPSRAEGPDDRGHVVGAVHRFDDDALRTQVVAPHLLDELGIVNALDEDAARAGDPRRRLGGGDRARRRER